MTRAEACRFHSRSTQPRLFLGVNEGSAGLSKAGGYVALVFAALGVYLYAGTIAASTGGRALPLGRPLV